MARLTRLNWVLRLVRLTRLDWLVDFNRFRCGTRTCGSGARSGFTRRGCITRSGCFLLDRFSTRRGCITRSRCFLLDHSVAFLPPVFL